MKAYTDIEQSKRLVEILPLESADMVYVTTGYSIRALPKEDEDANTYPKVSPCWSLAALLGVIPNFPALTQEDVNEWEVCVRDYNNDEYIEITADNPVDACVNMILKLHELNIL